MFVYLDAFIDVYKRKDPELVKVDGSKRIWRLLELAHQGIEVTSRRKDFLQVRQLENTFMENGSLEVVVVGNLEY